MRSHGVNIPDPTFNGSGGFGLGRAFGSVDRNSPAFQSALTACQSLRPAVRSRRRWGRWRRWRRWGRARRCTRCVDRLSVAFGAAARRCRCAGLAVVATAIGVLVGRRCRARARARARRGRARVPRPSSGVTWSRPTPSPARSATPASRPSTTASAGTITWLPAVGAGDQAGAGAVQGRQQPDRAVQRHHSGVPGSELERQLTALTSSS